MRDVLSHDAFCEHKATQHFPGLFFGNATRVGGHMAWPFSRQAFADQALVVHHASKPTVKQGTMLGHAGVSRLLPTVSPGVTSLFTPPDCLSSAAERSVLGGRVTLVALVTSRNFSVKAGAGLVDSTSRAQWRAFVSDLSLSIKWCCFDSRPLYLCIYRRPRSGIVTQVTRQGQGAPSTWLRLQTLEVSRSTVECWL